MKKTFKTMLALMAGAMTFTGCTSDILENTPEQIPSALKPMTFTATQESDATRAAIVGTAINWTTGDKISIFDGSTENDGNQAFTLDGQGGSPSGTFTGTAAEASTYYALYPYASSTESRVPTLEEAVAAAGDLGYRVTGMKTDYQNDPDELSIIIDDLSQNDISSENQTIIIAYLKNEPLTIKSGLKLNAGSIEGVTFPAAQTATVGTADPKAMLMIGTSDDTNNIQFKNVCAYLKVTPTFACSSIVLKSNGTESLAGTVTLGLDTDGVLTTTVTAGTNTATLSGTIAANSTYYIAVLPTTLATGFTVEFKDASNKVIGSKSTAKSVTFARNKVINLGSFNMYPPEGSNGSATRTGNAEVKWVQLWEDGPKWAVYNVGVTDGKAESLGGHYCWGRSIDKETPWTFNTGSVPLTGEDDTATALWGSNWRMPTKEDFVNLCAKCDVEWTTVGGVNGRIFTGRETYASNSIFLPATASCNNGEVLTATNYGDYWSSTPENNTRAWYLYSCNGYTSVSPFDRQCGFSVRAVLNEATTGTAKATIGGSDVDVNWVQLWADGPKFAEYNVGVTDGKAESYGGYYAWGGSQDKVNDHNTGTTALTGEYDTATKLWGNKWRMPTLAEFQALLKNCTKKMVTVEGVIGYKFTGNNDYSSNSIFLPLTGFCDDGNVCDQGEKGGYWSAQPAGSENTALQLSISDVAVPTTSSDSRGYGYSVRAVLK